MINFDFCVKEKLKECFFICGFLSDNFFKYLIIMIGNSLIKFFSYFGLEGWYSYNVMKSVFG